MLRFNLDYQPTKPDESFKLTFHSDSLDDMYKHDAAV